jgi:peptidoglycan hydrolase-like protein with peptidoglycan-binding domain
MDDPSFPRTFRPLRALIPGFPTLREVRWGGEFEGLTTFAVGLTGRSGFRVLELSQPSRVVIDVAHGAIVRQLRRGDRGADVRDWQGQLNAVQFGEFATSPSPAAGPLVTDGIFGPRTARATRILQRNEGVAATGVVDAATRRALRRAFGRMAP